MYVRKVPYGTGLPLVEVVDVHLSPPDSSVPTQSSSYRWGREGLGST